MDQLEASSIHLVATSPPYPMIEMWDDLFQDLAPESAEALAAGDGQAAFEAMHRALDPVWEEVSRVLVPGGVACVNIGDGVRSVDGTFQLWPNHGRIQQALVAAGLEPLPGILWRKPTTSPTKFMGSGMLPPRAYATLEHEHILVLRKPGTRRLTGSDKQRRYGSAYFWEERNRWFTDLWTDLPGTRQDLGEHEARERSAAFPLTLAYRLVQMFSLQGDTVLDPFWGTGTTSLAALVSARSSVGYELEPSFLEAFEHDLDHAPGLSRKLATRRLEAHEAFAARREKEGKPMGYEHEAYGFPVMTKQETQLSLPVLDAVSEKAGGWQATHAPVAWP